MKKFFAGLFAFVSLVGCGGSVGTEDQVTGAGGSGDCSINIFDVGCEATKLDGQVVYRCGDRSYEDSCGISHSESCGECPSGYECQNTICVGSGGQGGSAGSSGHAGNSGEAGQAGSAGSADDAGPAGAGGEAGSSGAGGTAGAGGSETDAGNDADAQPVVTQLHVSLASNPVTGVAVKKSVAIAALGIDVQAPQDSIVSMIQLRCQASIAGHPYQATQCADRIISISLFDGDQQIGLAIPPSDSGDVVISNMGWQVHKGQLNKLVAEITLASAATTSEPFDKVSIGFVAAVAQDSVTDDYVPVAADWDIVHDQLSDAPKVYTTIRPAGTFKVIPDSHPASSIVIAGGDVWKLFAGFKASAQYEAASSDMLLAYFCTSVVNGCVADNADFAQVAVASNGVILGVTTPPEGNDWWVKNLEMSSSPLITPKDGSVHFELWGKLAPVVPMGTGPAAGVARSGHAPALGMLGGYHSQEWDAAYTDKLNIQTTGMVSGERLYSEIDQNGSYTGNPMVIRKAKPVVMKQNLANTVLYNGDIEFVRFQVGAQGEMPNGNSIAFRQLAFEIEKTKGYDVGAFRLRRGALDIDPTQYRVVTVVNAANSSQATGVWVTFVWNEGYEETVTGSGNVYTVHGLVSGASPGSYLKIKMEATHQSQPKPITGYLLDHVSTGVLFLSPDGTNVNQSCPSLDCIYAAFGWSDFSGLPHQPLSVPQSSPDWTDGFLVDDINGVSQTLTQ